MKGIQKVSKILGIWVTAAVAALSSAAAQAAVCTAGQLDTTFGPSAANGYVQYSPFLQANGLGGGGIEGLAVDASGSLFAVGAVSQDSADNVTAAIVKVLKSGRYDATFAGVGYAVPWIQYTGGGTNVIADAAGNILFTANGNGGIQLFRFTSAGIADTGFASGSGPNGPTYGMASVALSSAWPITAVQQQPADGKYVVVASAGNPNANQVQPVVVRFNNDGSLDNSFGSGGVAYVFPASVTDPTAFGRATDIAVLPGGSIVVTGRIRVTGSSYFQPFVARLLPGGSLDPSFGTAGGFTLFDYGQHAVGRRMAVQSDGGIVVAGVTTDANGLNSVAIERTLANGIPDTTFGTSGTGMVQITRGYGVYAWSIAIQDNGKLVIGSSAILDASQATTAGLVIRLTTAGALDAAFGSGGFADIAAPNGGISSGDEVRIDPNNKIVYHLGISNPAPRGDDANYLVRLDTGTGKNCH